MPTDPPTPPPPRANLIVLPGVRRGRVVGTITTPTGERVPLRESFADGGDLEATIGEPMITSLKIGGRELLAGAGGGSTFIAPPTDLGGQASELVENIALLVRTRAAAWLRQAAPEYVRLLQAGEAPDRVLDGIADTIAKGAYLTDLPVRPPRRVGRRLTPGELATELRELREAAGLSQADLALHLGVSRSRVAHIEQGRRIPGAELVARWRTI